MTKSVVCIGVGAWGQNLVRNFHALGALQGICESDAGRRAQLASQYPEVTVFSDPREVFESSDVRAVAIATPAATHGSLARQALQADKDVFVEKPLCLEIPEAQALVDLTEARGRILMVGHLLWYHPAVLRLRELIDSGRLGRVQYLYSNRLNLGKIRNEENALWSFAPHDISVILGLLREMPTKVSAEGGRYLHAQIHDVTVTHLEFGSGARAHVFVSWLHPFKEQKLVVVGDRGMAVFDDTSDQKLLLYEHEISWHGGVPVARKVSPEVIPVDATEPLREECLHFLQRLEDRVTPRTDGQEGLRVLRVLAMAQGSLDEVGTPPGRIGTEELPYYVHESSYVDDAVTIGEGTKIWHFSHVLTGSRVGRHCRIGQNVVIGPDASVGDEVKIQNNVSVYKGVVLEDGVFCGPSMVFTNVYNPRSEVPRMDEIRETKVERGASLGANCTIVCGTTIGHYAFVGAGAVVLRDVPPYALVVGNPAHLIGWMCACGNRIRFPEGEKKGACEACGAAYARDGERVTPLEPEGLQRGMKT